MELAAEVIIQREDKLPFLQTLSQNSWLIGLRKLRAQDVVLDLQDVFQQSRCEMGNLATGYNFQ